MLETFAKQTLANEMQGINFVNTSTLKEGLGNWPIL